MARVPWHHAEYSQRLLICIPEASLTATYFTLEIGPEADRFWDVVAVDGYDVVFCAAKDGLGVSRNHERVLWDYANENVEFYVDYADYAQAADYSEFWWIYFGKDGVVVDPSTTVTATTPVLCSFTPHLPMGDVLATVPLQPGIATPSQRWGKTTYDEPYAWWEITEAPLGPELNQANGRAATSEFLAMVDWDATAGTGVYSAGTRQAAMTTQSKTYAVEDPDGRIFVGIFHDAGADGTDYIDSLRILTARFDGNDLVVPGPTVSREYAALLQVRNPSEA